MATANSVHHLVPNLNELIFGCITDEGISQLDLAVAIIQGFPVRYDPMGFGSKAPNGGYWIWPDEGLSRPIGPAVTSVKGFSPTTKPDDAFPLLNEITHVSKNGPTFHVTIGGCIAWGPTLLLATVRAYILSRTQAPSKSGFWRKFRKLP